MTFNLRIVVFLLVLVISDKSYAKETETQHCPSYCSCDLFENFNRAVCSGQQLITPNVEVPTAVELLDLSYNDITTLDNVCFEGLIYLVNLTLDHNALHTIYLDAFSSLRDAKFIDLSYNRLEYFDERIFEANTKLLKLDLSGNKFMSLQNKPLLRSSSIQYLGLHDAQVTYIYPQMFKEIPALREVDISNNLMITLSAIAFNSLDQLKTINLEQNRWICDNGFDATLKQMQRRGIEIKLSSCAVFDLKMQSKTGKTHMFERMMEAPPSVTRMESEQKEFISIEDVWKPKKTNSFESEEGRSCEEQSPVKICHLHRSCLANLRLLIKEKTAGEVISRGHYSEDDLKFIFFTGISLGIIGVIFLSTCVLCVQRCFKTQKKHSQRRTEVVNPTPIRRPIPPLIPPRQRRSNRRSRNPAPALNRSLSTPAHRTPNGNQGDFATFLTRFFERPTRHQYYRTINENTAHMIRRLSQSNLFNNRRSQNFATSPNTDGEEGQQSEPLVYPLAVERRNSLDQPYDGHRRTEERWEPPTRRPETPPPSYRDVFQP